MIVTIHQPNFIPWYPFFQKMEQSDIFIMLGHCQFEKNGFQNRFQINNAWNTLSVKKGKENIVDKKYINHNHDWIKIKKRLFEHLPVLNQLDDCICENLYETNYNIILKLRDMLNIKTKVVEDMPTTLNSTERLVMLCKKYGATTYLAGQGGKSYLDKSLFDREGINVVYQENLYKKHTLEYLNETI